MKAKKMKYRVQGYHVGLKRWETREFATKKEAEEWALDHCSHCKLEKIASVDRRQS